MKHRPAISLLRERIRYYNTQIEKQLSRHEPDNRLIDTWKNLIQEVDQSISVLETDQVNSNQHIKIHEPTGISPAAHVMRLVGSSPGQLLSRIKFDSPVLIALADEPSFKSKMNITPVEMMMEPVISGSTPKSGKEKRREKRKLQRKDKSTSHKSHVSHKSHK